MSNNFYALILPLRETLRLLSLGQFSIWKQVSQESSVGDLTDFTDVEGRSQAPPLPLPPSPSPPLLPSPPLRRDMYHSSMAVRSHQVTEDVYML